MLDNPLGQPLLLVLDPELHIPYISLPNRHHLFAAHAHTNAACSAAKKDNMGGWDWKHSLFFIQSTTKYKTKQTQKIKAKSGCLVLHLA